MSMQLKNVSFSYGNTEICRDLSWQLPSCGVVCLWGPSGCGKTTLLRLLAGLEKPQKGAVTGVSSVSMVFQEDRLLPWLSALQNVTLTGASEEKAVEMLTALGLNAEESRALPANLSGGQQRRVALARALAAEGDLLLLDEPFNGLDEATWRAVVPFAAAYAACRPVVLVTHIREQAEALQARIIPLADLPLTGEWKTEKILRKFDIPLDK